MTSGSDIETTVIGGKVSAKEFASYLAGVYDKITTAVRKRDVDSLAALYAPDAALMTPDGAFIAGTDSIKDAFLRFIDAGWIDQQAELVGLVLADGLVVEEGRSQGTFRADGATSTLRNNYIATHIRTADGGWVMHRDIWNSVSDTPPAGKY